jgi:membrane protein YqaA with SNARE-associated domain
MTSTAAVTTVVDSSATAAIEIMAPQARHSSPLLHFLFGFGLFGLFAVSIVDSSFVPLPVPGITDIMVVVLAARHSNWFLLVLTATLGSAIGGYLSYQIGQSGGMAFLEKRIPPRIFNRVRDWMERHAILAVALPAFLPPPTPLSPFVLAAGALKMSKKTFMTTFTVSRALRHSVAAWLGIHYGRHILRLWNHISAKYATTILIVLWTAIILSCVFAFWKLYKTSRDVTTRPQGLESGSETPA